MKKRNFLLVNILLYLALCVFGFFIYTRTNHISIKYLLKLKRFVFGEAVSFGIPALLSCLCAIPLGKLGKKKSTKIDFAIIGVLLTALFAILGVFFYGLAKDWSKYTPLVKEYAKPIYGNGLLLFVIFYAVVFACRYVYTCVFKKDSEEAYKTHAKSLFISLVFIGVVAAILGVRLFLFVQGNKSYKYFDAIPSKFDTILNGVVVCYALVGIVIAYLKPTHVANIIYNACACVIGLIIYFIIRNTDPNTYGKLSLIAAASATIASYIIIFGSYMVKTFIDLIIECNAPVEEVEDVEEDEAEEVEYASKESVEELEEKVHQIESDETRKYVYTLEDDNKILRARLEKVEARLAEIEANGVSASGKAEPHYETETVTVVRKGFKSRLVNTPNEGLKTVYQNIANLCNKYKKTKIRESFAKETIHVGRNNVCILKMSTSGKAMYMYMALDKSYLEQNKYHLKDYSEKKAYVNTPLRLRVSSNRSMQYALELLEVVLNNNAVKYVKDREDIDLSKQLKSQTETEMLKNGLIKQHYVENTYLVEPVYEEETEETEEEDED